MHQGLFCSPCSAFSISSCFVQKKTQFHQKKECCAGALEGSFLKSLVKLTQAKTVLEVGMFTGTSSLAMAEALPADGKVCSSQCCTTMLPVINPCRTCPKTCAVCYAYLSITGLSTQAAVYVYISLLTLQGVTAVAVLAMQSFT